MRNVGPTTAKVAAVYIEGISADFSPTDFSLTPGGSGQLTVTLPMNVNPGAAYTVKIVTASGAVFSYSVIAGRSA